MIGKLKGVIDSYGEDFVILDVHGVGYLVHCSARTLQALPAPGEAVDAGHRDPCARGPDPAVRLPVRRRARMVPAAADRAGRRHQGRARGPLHAEARPISPPPSRCATRRRSPARPGVGPKVAERIVTELKDKAPAFAAVDPALARLAGALDERRAPQPVLDAVSALVNLGYGQPQAAAAIAAALREAGDGADTAQLIRLGLKELAK